jgi:hypothetical protein
VTAETAVEDTAPVVFVFDCLQYDGQTWQVVAQDGPELALKDLV